MTLDVAKAMTVSAFDSILDYCNSVLYDMSQESCDRIQRAQNVLARVVVEAPRTISQLLNIRRD